MSAEHTLRELVELLRRAGIEFMLAGSFASTLHGEPRTTHDIDLVVELEPGHLERLLHLLPRERYYCADEAARRAVAERGQFNVIDVDSGWKIDLVVRKDRPFSREEFSRRVEVEALGTRIRVATAEDTILAKLEWSSRSGSERQLRDVAGIVRARGDALDTDYIERWATELGVAELWRRVLDER